MKNTKEKKTIKGHYFKIIKKNNKKIIAKYHKIKDWVMDPAGYFLIKIDRKNKLVLAAYCILSQKKNTRDNEMLATISGKTAIEIVNTLIRKKFISSLQHAGDMGIELCKAELALNYNLEYIQDKDLRL